jgi:hypothetical protein
MDGDEALRLVRIRCRETAPDGRGVIIARDLDSTGRVHFVLVQPRSGGRAVKFAVEPASGKLLEPPLDEP